MTKLIEKVIQKKSCISGKGVFAGVDIPKGHPILRIDDSRLVTTENPLREEEGEHEHHCDYLPDGKIVLMQAPEKYINHSCDPNTYVKTMSGNRYVFAISDIQAGEELTFEYCLNNDDETTYWECHFGSHRCRGQYHSNFLALPMALKLEYLPLLESWFIEEHKIRIEKILNSAR